MEIITRKQARARGLGRYFTGEACPKGHVAQRNTNSTNCLECDRIAVHRRRWARIDQYRATEKARRARRAERNAPLREARRQQRLAERDGRRKASAERERERSRLYRTENREACRAAHKRWRDANREKWRAHKRARKKLKKQALRADLLKLQRGRCGYCRTKLGADFHVDHIEPLARGGADQRSNMQALCPPCNLAKNAKDPINFAQELGRLI